MTESNKVFSGSVTMAANAWSFIVFDTPFEYDGTSNLVVVTDDNSGRYDGTPYMACSVYNTSTDQAIYTHNSVTNYNPMSPPTTSGATSWNPNANAVLSVKNHVLLGIEAEAEQIVELAAGANWFSTNLDITLDQLKSAIEAAVGTNGTATIKSQNSSISLTNGQWRPVNLDFDIREMYQIQVSADCELMLSGMPVNPAAYEITIYNGINWIGFLPSESMSIDEVFSGLNPEVGDVVKSSEGTSTFNGNGWRGSVDILEPGHGYIYYSNATDNKAFTYPTNSK